LSSNCCWAGNILINGNDPWSMSALILEHFTKNLAALPSRDRIQHKVQRIPCQIDSAIKLGLPLTSFGDTTLA
jgi:hypothetical protein